MAEGYAVQEKDGSIKGSRVHVYQDCSSLKSGTTLTEVSEREISLLGLKHCNRCARRVVGSPALHALGSILATEVPTDDKADALDVARSILDKLAEQGFYIAARGVRKSGIKDAS